MTKNIFLHRNAPARKWSPVATALFAGCICLFAGSCNKDFLPTDDDSSKAGAWVNLRLSTLVDRVGEEPQTEEVPGTRAVEKITGNSFPQGTNDIGVFMTTQNGGEVFPGGGDNMKATLFHTGSMDSETWKYNKKDGTPITSLKSKSGENLKVLAYYPYNAAATATAVPFDFTASSPLVQKDLLYNKATRQNLTAPSNGLIPLEFSHACSFITLKFSKSVNAGDIKISSVSIVNQKGEWIKNKGSFNPATGDLNPVAQAGPITDNRISASLDLNGSVEYRFLVPGFQGTVGNGDIAVKIVVDGKDTFYPLEKSKMTIINPAGAGTVGLIKGCEYTYRLEYDNLSLSFRLLDWTVKEPQATIGVPLLSETPYTGWRFDFKDINPQLLEDISNPVAITDHRYEDFWLDLDRGNNGSNTLYWANFRVQWLSEPPRTPLMFALKDAISVPVQWRDHDGLLIAKQICRNYREGGFSNWRLPRMSEWYMFERIMNTAWQSFYYPSYHKGDNLKSDLYWSGTESLIGEAGSGPYQVDVIEIKQIPTQGAPTTQIIGSITEHTNIARVRCVRDV